MQCQQNKDAISPEKFQWAVYWANVRDLDSAKKGFHAACLFRSSFLFKTLRGEGVGLLNHIDVAQRGTPYLH